MKKHSVLRKVLLVIVCVLIILAAAFGIYVSDYYHADSTAAASMQESSDIKVVNANGTISFWPKDSTDIGLIFYPGGKVEYTAYAPLLKKYAENGIACVLVKMPFNLAVFDINAADDVYDAYPEIQHWYIGGHSLGGAMAAYYASKHVDELDGLVLLGAYSTEDISSTDLKVAWIDGSNDQVINQKEVKKNENHYPKNTQFFTIAGGNHSQFGSYGHQKGDEQASIPAEQQWQETVKDSLAVMKG